MASELVGLRNQKSETERLSLEMAEMKRIIMSLRPAASTEGSLTTSSAPIQIQSQTAPVTQSPSIPIQPTSSIGNLTPLNDHNLLGAAGGPSFQQSLLDDVSDHIQSNTFPPFLMFPEAAILVQQ